MTTTVPTHGGPAVPASIVTDGKTMGRVATRVYGFTSAAEAAAAGYKCEAGPASSVYVVSAAELASGKFIAEGDPKALPMYAAPAGMKVEAGYAQPIVIVGGGLSVAGGGADSLTIGLLAYWKLDEASGTALDVLGTHNLTAINNPLGVAGKVGNARQFVAASTQALSNTSFALADDDFTIAAWINFTTRIAFAALISKQSATGRGQFAIYHDSSWLVGFQLYQDSAGALGLVNSSNFGALAAATWYHIVCTRKKTTGKIRVYVNTVYTEGDAPGVMGSSAQFQIGAWFDPYAHNLNGLVDEVGVWNRILTDTEIARLYNNS